MAVTPSLLFDLSTLSGCYYAPPGVNYGVGRVAAGLVEPLANRFGDDFGLCSGAYSAESHLYLRREKPGSAHLCIEPPTSSIETAIARLLDIGDPAGGIRLDPFSKLKRKAWRPYNEQLRWRTSRKTRETYANARLIHAEFGMPVILRCPKARKIHTIHDIIRYRDGSKSREELEAARKGYRESLEKGAYFSCDSQYTADDISDFLGGGFDGRILSMSLGLDPVFRPSHDISALASWRERLGLTPDDRYIIAHTGDIARKNLVTVIEVVHTLRNEGHPGLKLVFAGAPKKLTGEFAAMVPASIPWREFTRFTGYISDKEFPILYAGAEFLLFLSLAEGFGLPPLEAMGCGLPVISSDRTSLPEVVGDAGMLVDPLDHAQICQAATSLLDSPGLRASLVEKSLGRAALFTWEKTGQALISIWEKSLLE